MEEFTSVITIHSWRLLLVFRDLAAESKERNRNLYILGDNGDTLPSRKPEARPCFVASDLAQHLLQSLAIPKSRLAQYSIYVVDVRYAIKDGGI